MTALVLAGGGTRGAVQIGMLQVLTEHGFVPDRIYGSSVGAVNGAAFAGDPTRAGGRADDRDLAGLTRDDVYPQGRLHGPWLYFQQRDSVYANSGLRKVIDDGITFERLEDAVIPVEVVATSLTDGRERWFTYGPAVEAVLASSAVPAIFPPVEIDGERFIDGGVVNNVPIRRAIDAGATRIVVLLCAPPAYTPVSPQAPGRGHAQRPVDLHPRPVRPGHGPAARGGGGHRLQREPRAPTRDFDDFSTTEALIAQGREEASEVVRRYGLGRPGRGGRHGHRFTTPRPVDRDRRRGGRRPTGRGPSVGIAGTHPAPGARPSTGYRSGPTPRRGGPSTQPEPGT